MTAKKSFPEIKTEVAELPESRAKVTATVPAAEVERQIELCKCRRGNGPAGSGHPIRLALLARGLFQDIP